MTGRPSTDLVCPSCHSPLQASADSYRCESCSRDFPILFGIPDFRLRGDLYLSLEDERAKAGRLHLFGQHHDFASLVDYYYSITDDVPERLAPTFAGYVLKASERAIAPLATLAPTGGRALLDLGCGSGGALVAARDKFEDRTGVDIALRWLVIAQKRLDELGVEARLVCADAETLPFPDGAFSHVLASDLLENTRSPGAALAESGRVLERSGGLYVSSSNRNWVGPHPATGVWAAGLVPSGMRANLLKRSHGVDILRAVTFISPGSVRRMARLAGLRQVRSSPLNVDVSSLESRPRLFRSVASIYSLLAKVPLIRTLMISVGPVFETLFVKEEVN